MIAITRSSSSSSEAAVVRHPAVARHDAAPARRELATAVDRPTRLAALATAPSGRWASENRIGLDVTPTLVRRPVEEEVEEYERWDGLA